MSRALLLAFLTALLLFPTAARSGTSDVVVSQIYGGGGNAGATFRNDYVELFNGGSGTVDLSGWTVQYATAAGTTWQATALSGTIAAGHYYLVQLASNADVGAVLPPPDATGTSNLGGTSGKIALVRGATALTCGASAGSCSGDPLLADLVGYGNATEMLLTGDFVDAKRAYEIGLYNRVVTQAQVLPEARAVAEQLARGPSAALGVTKQALEAEAALDFEAALAYEAEVQARLMQGSNFREAHEAFRAKRDPKFI